MAIANRDLVASQQRECFQSLLTSSATGVSNVICLVPYPAIVAAAAINTSGISGAPTVTLNAFRYVAGGATLIGTVAQAALTVAGATVPQGFSMWTGASAPLLLAGDLIVAQTGGANSSLFLTQIVTVLQALQDTKTHFGV